MVKTYSKDKIISLIKLGNIDKIKSMLRYCEYNDVKEYIIEAIRSNNLKIVEILFDFYPEIHLYWDRKGFIDEASKYGYINIIKYFFDIKKCSAPWWYYEEAIKNAIKNGNIDIVKYLIENSYEESYNIPSWKYYELIVMAISYNNKDIIIYLIEKSGAITQDALEMAIKNKDIDMFRFLIKQDIRFGIRINELVDVAQSTENTEIINFVDRIVNDYYDGHFKIYTFEEAVKKGNLKIAENYIKNGDHLDSNLNELLIFTCEHDDTNMSKLLIDAGADLRFNKDEPLKIASNNLNYELVKILIEKGADTKVINNEILMILLDL